MQIHIWGYQKNKYLFFAFSSPSPLSTSTSHPLRHLFNLEVAQMLIALLSGWPPNGKSMKTDPNPKAITPLIISSNWPLVDLFNPRARRYESTSFLGSLLKCTGLATQANNYWTFLLLPLSSNQSVPSNWIFDLSCPFEKYEMEWKTTVIPLAFSLIEKSKGLFSLASPRNVWVWLAPEMLPSACSQIGLRVMQRLSVGLASLDSSVQVQLYKVHVKALKGGYHILPVLPMFPVYIISNVPME